MKLVLPTAEFKDSFIGAVKEFREKGEVDDRGHHYAILSADDLESHFDTYLEREENGRQGLGLPEGYVPQTTYWLIDNNEFIGRVSIRHRLTEHLKQIGGHIGYDIRPSKRKQGYGNKILELVLPKAKELGIDRALLTCDESNLGSRKIIEKNAGVLENKVENPETGVDKLRFWIEVR